MIHPKVNCIVLISTIKTKQSSFVITSMSDDIRFRYDFTLVLLQECHSVDEDQKI